MRKPSHLLIMMLISLTCSNLSADDWPQWRGPTSDSVSNESAHWPIGWEQDGPAEVWRQDVGVGCTSPIIVDGKLYVLGWHGPRNYHQNPMGKDELRCYDLASGKLLWKQTYESRYQARQRIGDERMYGGPSATPTYDIKTNRIYTFSNDAQLICRDATKQGKVVWQFNLNDRYEIKRRNATREGQRDYGRTMAPYILGDQLIVDVGATDGTVISFNKHTGKENWKSEYRKESGHTGGFTPMTLNGETLLVMLALRDVVVFHADGKNAGKTVATTEWITGFNCNIPSPSVIGNRILITSGYDTRRSTLYELKGKDLNTLWRSRAHSVVGSPVIQNNIAYFVNNRLELIRLSDGDEVASEGRYAHGSAIYTKADDKIIAWGKGMLGLHDAKTGKTLATVKTGLRADCYPHVALSEGNVVVKDRDGNVVVYSLVKPKPPKVVPIPESKMETERLPDGNMPLVFSLGTEEVTPRGNARVDKGVLTLEGGAMLADDDANASILANFKNYNELSIAIKLQPSKADQRGPARIVSFSTDPYLRNFTLAQEGDHLLMRLRTSKTDRNGMNPQTRLFKIEPERPTFVVISYKPGKLTAYRNGELMIETDQLQGDFSNWEPQHLVFGNEYQEDRPWHGRIEQVELYTKFLSPVEVAEATKYEADRMGYLNAMMNPETAAEAKPADRFIHPDSLPTRGVKVTDNKEHQGCICLQIETPNGIWLYDKAGGGFAALFDKDGNDWISYRPKGGSAGNYRGIPNLRVFHPGQTNCETKVIMHDSEQVTLQTQTKDGKWACQWRITESAAHFTLTKAAGSYWFLYEGTPGGMFDKDDGVCFRSGNQQSPLGDRWAGALSAMKGQPAWVAFSSNRVSRAILVVHHEDDDAIDSYWPMQNNMTVFGFGRDGKTMKTYMDKSPATFSVLLVDDPDAEKLQRAAASQLNR